MSVDQEQALRYLIEEAGQPATVEVNGRLYSTKNLMPVKEPSAPTITVTSLKALVEYLAGNIDGLTGSLMVHVVSPTRVEVKGPSFGPYRQRDVHLVADCSEILPKVVLGKFLDQETFLILLRASFTPAGSRDEIINIASAVAAKNEMELKDDGISQSINIKKGINRLQSITVPNPIKLAPFRTFVDVEQPASEMIFRINGDAQFMLLEADGGAWRNKAMNLVQQTLEFELNGAGVVSAKVIA